MPARAKVDTIQTHGIRPPVTGSGPCRDTGTETMLVASTGAAVDAVVTVGAVVVDAAVVVGAVVVDAGVVVVVTHSGTAVVGAAVPAPAVAAKVRPRRMMTTARRRTCMAFASHKML
jgi:hypothetical protein